MTVDSIDIVPPRSDPAFLTLGRGWYAPEVYGGTHFRWVKNDAEIFVASLGSVSHSLKIMIEPGPGVSLKPFSLQVLESGRKIAEAAVQGKQIISVPLPAAGPKIYRLTLHVEGGGNPTPKDTRIMNFRVFDIAIEHGIVDVLPAVFQFGTGWYALESYKNLSFRWVNNDAELMVDNTEGLHRLAFDVEPGPGLNYKPFVLKIVRADNGQKTLLSEIEVRERQTVDLEIPNAEMRLQLHVDDRGKVLSSDPRLLNFRVFAFDPDLR